MQFVDEHSTQLVPPVFYQNMKPINNLKKIEDVYLLKDMISLRHLVAILYQIILKIKIVIFDGNKYFGYIVRYVNEIVCRISWKIGEKSNL